jgi:hypothetical protein
VVEEPVEVDADEEPSIEDSETEADEEPDVDKAEGSSEEEPTETVEETEPDGSEEVKG